jgi:hypothetical protein
MDDLDESARMLEQLFAVDLKDHAEVAQLRRASHDRLGRAFLNRAHDALLAGQSEIARNALRKGLEHSPRLIKTILGDPRLCAQMTALAVAPRLAARLFGRPCIAGAAGRIHSQAEEIE